VIATSAPSAASAFAMDAPMPRLAPVTKARFPVRDIISLRFVMIDTKLLNELIPGVKGIMCCSSQKET
jgi:hypothetical protein